VIGRIGLEALKELKIDIAISEKQTKTGKIMEY
jgi:hypothetical protein